MLKTCFNEVDPVCGMVLDSCKAEFTEDFEGKTYGFDTQQCKDLFHGNPKKYIENPSPRKMMPGHRDIPEKHNL
jgi:YHS domain-containing protein